MKGKLINMARLMDREKQCSLVQLYVREKIICGVLIKIFQVRECAHDCDWKENNAIDKTCIRCGVIYRLTAILFCLNKGKIPWLWMPTEALRGRFTTMSDV